MPTSGQLGVLIDGLYSVEYAVNNLAIPDTEPTGNVTQEYSAPQTIQAQIEKDIPKTGARIDFYDPELSAILGGEL